MLSPSVVSSSFSTPWTVAHQAPLSMKLSRQEYWRRLLFPPPGDLPNPGIEPASLLSPALAGRYFAFRTTREPIHNQILTAYTLISYTFVKYIFATPWTVAHQAPPSKGFSRQEYWARLPFPSPGDLPDPGIEPGLLHCRQMLYHLSHQGNPSISQQSTKKKK